MNNQFEYKRSDDRNYNEIQRGKENLGEGIETSKKNLGNRNKDSGN